MARLQLQPCFSKKLLGSTPLIYDSPRKQKQKKKKKKKKSMNDALPCFILKEALATFYASGRIVGDTMTYTMTELTLT